MLWGLSAVIDVVVPVRDHAATLTQLLQALLHREVRSIVVVDRASRDRSAEVARDSGALVLREPTGGYRAACPPPPAHFSSLPPVPDPRGFVPGAPPAPAHALPAPVAPLVPPRVP